MKSSFALSFLSMLAVIGFVVAVYNAGVRQGKDGCKLTQANTTVAANEAARETLEKVDNETRKIPDSLLDRRLSALGIMRADQDR